MTASDIAHIYERACLRKANLSEETANRIIDLALKQREQMLYYYKCQFCSSFHLTSKEPFTSDNVKVV